MKRECFNNLIKQTVRSLRRNQTKSEAILWEALRNRKLSGKKFLRQHPIIFEWDGKKRFIITDFYCHEAKLIVEVDGGVHEKQKEYDEMRNFVVKSMGFRIIRFKNDKILMNLPDVLVILNREITLITPSLYKRGGAGPFGRRG